MQEQFDPNDRISHVNPDLEKGFRKARKIRGVIERHRSLRGLRMLDAGCGGGAIAVLLAESVGSVGRVVGCDMHERQATREGYGFRLLESDELPFEDDSFDVVVPNHVLEHVGPQPAQVSYLAEIRRVLKSDGLPYLAVANRWRLVAQHFDLPMLFSPPRRVADAYVRRTGEGTHYDVHPATATSSVCSPARASSPGASPTSRCRCWRARKIPVRWCEGCWSTRTTGCSACCARSSPR